MSYPLTRERPAQIRHCVSWFFIGLFFLLIDTFATQAMVPQVYGQRAYQVDASIWAMLFMSSNAVTLRGLQINGRWKYSPLLRIVGYTSLSLLFVVLIVSSLTAPYGVPIWGISLLYFLPTTLWFLKIAVQDHRARVNG